MVIKNEYINKKEIESITYMSEWRCMQIIFKSGRTFRIYISRDEYLKMLPQFDNP